MKRYTVLIVISILIISFIAIVLFGLISFVQEYETPKVYETTVAKYCCEYEVDVNFVYAVIKVESKFKEKAESKKGARGLMQIMPSTAQYIAVKLSEDINNIDLFDPEVNLKYGIWYLSYLNKMFNDDKMLVSAAYNAGEGNVKVWIEKYSMFGFKVSEIPFAETKHYVEKVLRYFEMYRNKYGY